jgi:hypothetical protein
MSSNLFDRLADELVLKIMDHTNESEQEPMDHSPVNPSIRQLSRCNSRLRRISLPLLYHTIRLVHWRGLNQFLRVIIDTPSYISLVKTLDLYWDERRYRPFDIMDDTDLAVLVEEAEKCDLPDDFVFPIEIQEPWANIFLLLHLLRDLEVLRIASGNHYQLGHEFQFFWADEFELLLAKFLNRRLLSKNLKFFVRDAGQRLNVGVLMPAFMLPSVMEIHASLLGSVGTLEGHWALPKEVELSSYYRKSNVEKLALYFAELYGREFAQLIQIPRALKTLIYKGEDRRGGSNPIMASFRNTLDHVADSLEILDIQWPKVIPSDGSFALWSFHNFSSLKVLYVDYILLYGLDPTVAPSIVECLPPNLEVLGLHLPNAGSWTTSNFMDSWKTFLIESSSQTSTRLRVIAHLHELELLFPLADLARSCGIRIALEQTDLE